MRIVAALGGNALLRRGEAMTEGNQRANVHRAAAALAPLCTDKNEVILTHGNGPQVGLLALQSSAGPKEGRYPLDVLSAQSEGLLGYLIEQELRNVLPPDRLVASLLTQVLVDPADPAFLKPTKPIGPGYPEDEAQRLATERGWNILQDGAFWRRAVPSPRPFGILEQSVIALLASQGVIVICVGGGGIPVAFGDDGQLHGVEAVIDKDRASALLAEETGADALLLLTDVDGVYLDWGKPGQRAISVAGPDAFDPSVFETGTIRPKIEAAAEFARNTGCFAAIGRLEDAVSLLLSGTTGTRIDRARSGLQLRA